MLNIASLVLGIGAWLSGVLAIKCTNVKHTQQSSAVSFSLCLISVILQFFEINRRVLLGDYAAIEDTIRAVILASVMLASVTVILNLMALIKSRQYIN